MSSEEPDATHAAQASRSGTLTAAWRAVLQIEADRLNGDLRRVPADRRGTPEFDVARDAQRALEASLPPPHRLRERILDWYSGAAVERGWAARAQLREALIGLRDTDDLRAHIPALRRGVSTYIADADVRRDDFLQFLEECESGDTPVDTAARHRLQAIRRAVDGASDFSHRNIRRFRNLLLMTSLGLVVLLVVVAVAHALNPTLVDLCTEADTGAERCIHGSRPHGTDVLEIELVGALAGLLGAMAPLARLRRLEGPYSLPAAQIILKVPTGAATALIGVVLIQGGVLGDLVSRTGDELIAYAAFFGFAQQILTRFVDERASEVAASSTAVVNSAQSGGGGT